MILIIILFIFFGSVASISSSIANLHWPYVLMH